jgi:hypothetical protein
MMDLLLVSAILGLLSLRFFLRWPLKKTLPLTLFLAFLFYAASLFSLYRNEAQYDYTLYPSQAAAAGIAGSGRVSSVKDLSHPSIGAFFANALWERELLIAGGKSFTRTYEPLGWKFWRALDSYILEESSGGLGLLPRRPIYRGVNSFLRMHFLNFRVSRQWRLIELQGKKTNTIGDLLREINPIPEKGISLLRMMRPTPDNGVATLLLSPKAFAFPQLENLANEQASQVFLGLSGLHMHLTSLKGWRMTDTVIAVDSKPIYGPQSFANAIAEEKESHFLNIQNRERPFAKNNFSVLLQPRLALLPWLHENVFVSWVMSVPGSILRQIISLPNIFVLPSFGRNLPMQAYLLDDSFSGSFLFFKLGSLFVSLFLSLLLVQALAAWKLRILKFRFFFVFFFFLWLQTTDLFVIHRFLL